MAEQFFCNKKFILNAVCLGLTGIIATSVFMYALNHTVAVAVVCDGDTVGYVKDSTVADSIESTVKSMVFGEGITSVSLSFEDRFVSVSSITEEANLTDIVLSSIDGVNKYTALYTDGILTAVANSSQEMNDMINSAAVFFTPEGAQYVGYTNAVEIKEIFATSSFVSQLASCLDDFKNGKSGLSFVTTKEETYEESVGFKTETTYDSNKNKGYYETVRKGVKGKNKVTKKVTYINGEASSSEVLKTEVLSEPVSAKVVRGITDKKLSDLKATMVSGVPAGAKYVFPCQILGRTYISSYWGDGRGHKGIDIASPKNSEIYAAASGTVVTAVKGHSSYGNYVVIDHGDGKTETLYAHCNSLNVKKGDKVKAGQVIAFVGTTGRSTGNHLHFEIKINGTRIDPAPYIGL